MATFADLKLEAISNYKTILIKYRVICIILIKRYIKKLF